MHITDLNRSRENHISIWQQRAYDIVAQNMRRNYGRFTEAQLYAQAYAALAGSANNFTTETRRHAAGHIARSISRNFDPAKCRPPPKQNRAAKTKRNNAIQQFVASAHTRVSAADVAKKFGISKTTAHRILKSSGYYDPLLKTITSYSTPAIQIIGLFREELPSECYRLVSLKSVLNAISASEVDAPAVFDEINSAAQPLQLHLLDTPTLDGRPTFLVAERGRRKSGHFLKIWGLRQVVRMTRNPRLRTDQRVILNLDDAPTPQHPVLRDIAAVIRISLGSESLNTWRRFIEASTVVGAGHGYIRLSDPEALINALNGAIRRRNFEENLPRISTWLLNEDDRSGARQLLSIAADLRETWISSPYEAYRKWSEATHYRERIEQNLLPWRKLHDLDMAEVYGDITDARELLHALWRNPSDRIWFDPYGDRLDDLFEDYFDEDEG